MSKNISLTLSVLDELEAEALHIIREVAAEFERPVMLYSIGKDSSVMLHLALKAFWPSLPPFPLLHVDTRYKFPEMVTFRDQRAAELGLDLQVHYSRSMEEKATNPWDMGSVRCCGVLKTQGLLDALHHGRYDTPRRRFIIADASRP